MEYASEQEKVLDDEEAGGWVDTHHYAEKNVEDKASEMCMDDDGGATAAKTASTSATAPAASATDQGESDDEEAVDMEDFVESGMLEDAATIESPAAAKKSDPSKSAEASKAGGGEIVPVRTYDLNITYDKYYQTPRLWLFGYDENRKVLSVDEMYEDFSADHANKTITIETHPHLPGPPQASVHPCRHAQVMKKLIDQIMEGGGELGVHMYLIVFLKFVQAIIPTIEYDFTQNFAL